MKREDCKIFNVSSFFATSKLFEFLGVIRLISLKRLDKKAPGKQYLITIHPQLLIDTSEKFLKFLKQLIALLIKNLNSSLVNHLPKKRNEPRHYVLISLPFDVVQKRKSNYLQVRH